MRFAVGVVIVGGCRGWHDPLPFDECQPYPLECESCLFEDDLVEDGPVLRVWQCEDPDLGLLQAIRRRAETAPAADTHFYTLDTGTRVASVREHDAPVPVCGEDHDEEWWGLILDCVDVCEIDDTLPETDPDLELCAL